MESNLKHIPLEVVELILSNLGVSDLLTCRLVDRDWNRECLRQLRKSNGRKPVEIRNIGSVLEFVTNSSAANSFAEPGWVIPFELNLNFDQEDFEDPSSTVQEKFTQQVSSLLELAPASIFDINLVDYCPQGEDTFRTWVQILSKCSSHLKRLNIDFWDVPLSTPISINTAVNILRHANLTFPRLKTLSIDSTWILNSLSIVPCESLVHVLIRQSPNLEQLQFFNEVLHFGQNSRYTPLPVLHKLKKLSVRQDWSSFSSALNNSIPAPHTMPNLASLRLSPGERQFEAEQQTQTLRTILLSFSTTLKSLTIENFPSRLNSIEERVLTVTPIKFPIMACLEHLQVGLRRNSGIPVYANLNEFNFSQANFPALKSVDIEFGFYWGAPAPTLPIEALESVERLTLRLRKMGSDEYCSSCAVRVRKNMTQVQNYMTHVQNVFPNVSSLCLVNDNFENLRPVLEGVFGSSRAHQIHSFEYIDRSTNALIRGRQSGKYGYFALPVNNMKNVTKFRVQRTDGYIKKSDLKWFTKKFPSLAQIEMLVPSEWRCKAKEAEYLQVLKKYPNFAIKADHLPRDSKTDENYRSDRQ